ncbi:Endonuclease III-like protein 1 [Cichlidogyrus casuarinus]|uniref:Endonuclease III homolog n=1 Tax=Cichlidogyrus casuarinus TaxID=1844966 RepID=A0ABD2QIR4_9PLAT
MYENLKKMRESRTAPVDTVGCERLADEDASPKLYRLQVLFALMLSSQTKDQVTAEAMKRLKENKCDIDKILTMPVDSLEKLLIPVGFYKKKAVYMKKVCQILRDKYDDDIPSTMEELCDLPGVGPKMALLTLSCAWKRVEGIAVDTHVHRIANRWHWTRKPTKTPEETRRELQSWFPREEWPHINWLLVGFGQEICLPVKPKCQQCLNKEICPSSNCKSKPDQTN